MKIWEAVHKFSSHPYPSSLHYFLVITNIACEISRQILPVSRHNFLESGHLELYWSEWIICIFHIIFSILLNFIYLFTQVPHCLYRGHRTIYGSWLSPSILWLDSWDQTQVTRLEDKCPSPLSYVTGYLHVFWASSLSLVIHLICMNEVLRCSKCWQSWLKDVLKLDIETMFSTVTLVWGSRLGWGRWSSVCESSWFYDSKFLIKALKYFQLWV